MDWQRFEAIKQIRPKITREKIKFVDKNDPNCDHQIVVNGNRDYSEEKESD